ncbi:MAG: outer membrane protein assembly factor [Rhodobiaceae bacterium]|nr:outer membrane protein assembly factor [Rhodobiaceae bacterium]MCC0056048.1 outer membrane protein assembly factor [Rhodobiaceae bacterium]
MTTLLAMAIAMVAFAVLCAPQRAQAFELFGVKFLEGGKLFNKAGAEAEDTIGEPHNYDVEFVVTGEGVDKDTLEGASNLWTDRKKPASGAGGLIAKARGDYDRMLGVLYAEARYGGSISIEIDGREASGLPPDARLNERSKVRILIDPGPEFTFGEARIINQAPAPLSRGDEVELPAAEGFLTGQVAKAGTVLKAERLAIEAWRQLGHAKAKAARRVVEADHRTQTLDVTITIDPGPLARYGATTVEGTERMDPDFVAYMAGLTPGKEYDPDDVDRGAKRLARMDVFRSVRIEEAETIGPDGLLDHRIPVQERKLRRFGVGASYSSVDGAGLEAYWLHRNLFGRAERFRLEGRVAGINSGNPDDYTYRLGATFTKPGTFTPDTDFSASVIGEREVLEPYTRTGVTATAGYLHRFDEYLTGKLYLDGRHARFKDVPFGTRDFSSLGFLAGIAYDTRDKENDATRGVFAELVAEPFHEFNYGNTAARFTAEARAYLGLGNDDRLVLAGRAKIGTLAGSSIAQTAPDRLFFAGGGGSVRGYAYRNIGVTLPSGFTVGGRSLVEGSVELRARVTDTLGVVAFADAGTVGMDPFDAFGEDLHVGVGAGIRYYTGLGPLRFDVAFPLDKRPGDPDVAFYVGIGQAF